MILKKINWIIVFGLGLLAVFFSLYKVDNRYIFDWDQEDDAYKVMGIIENRKPLLIGQRVTSENSFFAGPYHYYFLLPFYGLMQGNPKAGMVAMVFVNAMTAISMYIVANKLYGPKVGMIASVLMLINISEISWSVMYLSLFGIWGWWGVCKILQSRKNVKWVVPMWGFFSVTHLVPTSIGLAIGIAWLLSIDKKYSKKDLIIGILGGLVFLTPLVVFDLRHDFLNLRKFLEMLQGKTKVDRDMWLPVRTYFRSLSILSIKWLGEKIEIIERIVVIFLACIGILNIKNRREKIVGAVWILTPLLAMFVYKGGVSEYYFSIGLVVVMIVLAQTLAKLGKVTIVILVLLMVSNFLRINKAELKTGLKNKMDIATYLVNQQTDKVFNLSYELPLGWDNGFGYLFKYLGKEPQNVDEGHLYTVMLDIDEGKTGQTVTRSGVYILKRR